MHEERVQGIKNSSGTPASSMTVKQPDYNKSSRLNDITAYEPTSKHVPKSRELSTVATEGEKRNGAI